MQFDKNSQQSSMTFAKPHDKYRNIIFDLGAVLVYWYPEAIIRDMFKHEKSVPLELLELVKTPEWLEVDRGTLSGDDVVALFSDRFNPAYVRALVHEHKHYLKPIEAGIEILQAVKACGYRTYVLSNMGPKNFQHIAENTQFLQEFDGMIISYQVGMVKPEPGIYQKLLETYGLKPEESLFIDDMEKNIVAAQELGIDGIVCTDHETVFQELQRMKVLP